MTFIGGKRRGLGEHLTLEAAKAAAQKDYEQRIRSALEPDPQDARVAEAAQTIVTAMERAQIDMSILRMFYNGEPATALRVLAAFDKGGKDE